MRKNFIFLLLVAVVGFGLFAVQSARKNVLPASVEEFQNQPGLIYHGSRDKKEIALTFDADMTPYMLFLLKTRVVRSYYNNKIINILDETQTPATLFLGGMWMEAYPQVTRALARDPLFELANHSYSHPTFEARCTALTLIPDSKDEEEIQKTQALLKEFTGKDNKLFRFPGGCFEKSDLEIVKKLGLTAVQWDVASGDSFNSNTQQIINYARRARSGSIILFHLHGSINAPKTAEALPTIISELKKQGYTFVTVSQLLEGQ